MAQLPAPTHYIFIFRPFDPGEPGPEPLTWSADDLIFDQESEAITEFVDTGSDDILNNGDFYAEGATDSTYRGHVIEFTATNAAGETATHTYAIFTNNVGIYIPYNKPEGDIAPQALMGGTSTFVGDGPQVFNCFATGAMIATPDGERAIETFQPGDRVLTRDGRSVPVIWVAR